MTSNALARNDESAPAHKEGEGDPVAAILKRAADRGQAAGLAYAGLVTPGEAHWLLAQGAAVIVDVRTRQEWEFVGRVEGAALIEWRSDGATSPDPHFVAKLSARLHAASTILFLCRSGVRSHHAAEASARAGFTRAYNILEGFEGDLDPQGRRGNLGGWRKTGLPWTQG